jgi:hypothetical protein
MKSIAQFGDVESYVWGRGYLVVGDKEWLWASANRYRRRASAHIQLGRQALPLVLEWKMWAHRRDVGRSSGLFSEVYTDAILLIVVNGLISNRKSEATRMFLIVGVGGIDQTKDSQRRREADIFTMT